MKSLHSKLEDLVRHGSPGRKSLEVPSHQHAAILQHVTKDETPVVVNIAVPPNNTKTPNNKSANNNNANNVVAPWENEDDTASDGPRANVVAPWEDDDDGPAGNKVSNVVAPWEDED